jgi:hypothetical protein
MMPRFLNRELLHTSRVVISLLPIVPLFPCFLTLLFVLCYGAELLRSGLCLKKVERAIRVSFVGEPVDSEFYELFTRFLLHLYDLARRLILDRADYCEPLLTRDERK